MTEFALVEDGVILKFREFERTPGDPIGKGWVWLPVENNRPTFDPATENLVFDTFSVEEDKVVRNFKVEVKVLARNFVGELDALKLRVAALEAKQ